MWHACQKAQAPLLVLCTAGLWKSWALEPDQVKPAPRRARFLPLAACPHPQLRGRQLPMPPGPSPSHSICAHRVASAKTAQGDRLQLTPSIRGSLPDPVSCSAAAIGRAHPCLAAGAAFTHGIFPAWGFFFPSPSSLLNDAKRIVLTDRDARQPAVPLLRALFPRPRELWGSVRTPPTCKPCSAVRRVSRGRRRRALRMTGGDNFCKLHNDADLHPTGRPSNQPAVRKCINELLDLSPVASTHQGKGRSPGRPEATWPPKQRQEISALCS